MKFRLLKDAGEGTPVSECPNSPFKELMAAIDELIIEREYIADGRPMRRQSDGRKWIFMEITSTEERFEPGSVVNGKVISEAFYIGHQSETIAARLWIEVSDEPS